MEMPAIVFVYDDVTKVPLQIANHLWIARAVGFRPIIASWDHIGVGPGFVEISNGVEILADGKTRGLPNNHSLSPSVVVHRKLTGSHSEAMFSRLAIQNPNTLVSHHPLWKKFASKWWSEVCFRNGAQQGIHVARPTTYLVDKHRLVTLKSIGSTRPLIFKPATSFECNGILVSTPSTFDRVVGAAIEAGPDQYVVQDVVTDSMLYGGRKFDIRVYVLITSFSPPRFKVFRGGVVKVAARPFSEADITPGCVLTGSNYRRKNGYKVEDVSISDFLSQVKEQGISLVSFWRDVEELIDNVVRCLAADLEVREAADLVGRFFLTGVDFLVRITEAGSKLLFLEANYAPSLVEWGTHLDDKLRTVHRQWLEILFSLCTSGECMTYET
jgi:hypothetical protein